MDERILENNGEMEIDLRRIGKVLLRKSGWICLSAVLCAALLLVGTLLIVPPAYQSSTMIYVNNNSVAPGDAADSISSADISASRGLVKSYIVILNSRQTLMDVIEYAEIDRTCEQLKRMITAEAVDSTEIFEVVVTGPDPEEARKIADAIACILPGRITDIIEGTSAKIVDSAVVSAEPSSPDYLKNTALGFLAGMLLSAGAVVLWVLLDVTIRSEEDVAQTCRYPVLAAVPDMDFTGKNGGTVPKSARLGTGQMPELIGSGISFAAAESYKLLRTKLLFSFADESASHVIGISSACSEEGKSICAINLAYSLSQLDKRVILLDCDMRRPSVAEKLGLRKRPGLSDFLTGQCPLENLVQYWGIPEDRKAFRVLSAGQSPPDPIELLSSLRMERLLVGLKKICDYVILDLPPVEEVSDALAVARNTDGILLVVRQDHGNRLSLGNTVRQFEFVGAKILGILYNGTQDGPGKSGYQKYYGRDSGEKARKRRAPKRRKGSGSRR